mmetsp:Transcript_68420/g.164254  ORF Transcript_68420/g.164254 Transcript_68420/m.164254 type:complete len:818 (-) Transcript_68420:67-2520(-)
MSATVIKGLLYKLELEIDRLLENGSQSSLRLGILTESDRLLEGAHTRPKPIVPRLVSPAGSFYGDTDVVPCERTPPNGGGSPVTSATLTRARSGRIVPPWAHSPRLSDCTALKDQPNGFKALPDNDVETLQVTSIVPVRQGSQDGSVHGGSMEQLHAMRPQSSQISGSDNDPSANILASPSGGNEPRASAQLDSRLRDCWLQHEATVWSYQHRGTLRHGRPSERDMIEDDHADVEPTRLSFLRPLIAPPTSSYRLGWDFGGAILIFFDLIIIPLRLLEWSETPFTIALNWISLIYWTMNMLATPFVGYVKNGKTVMEPGHILVNYLRLWFWLDCVVVIPDWVFAMASLSSSDSSGSSVRLLRILRLTRMVRLIRVGKLKAFIRSIVDLIDSEYMSIIWNIVMMILALLFLNHFVACSFCAVGKLDWEKPANTWVVDLGFDSEPITTQYLTAFHWSMTQFTPSTMDIAPQNTMERLFAIAVVVMALVIFAYMVGSITSSLTQLRMMQEDANKAFWTLRRYMRQHTVRKDLASRIERYCEHAWVKRSEKVSEGSVLALSLLTEQMHRELRCEMNRVHLKCHPLFEYLYNELPVTVHRLASQALSNMSLARADIAFVAGEKATHTLFVVSGTLRYDRHRAAGSSGDNSKVAKGPEPEMVHATDSNGKKKGSDDGRWISELALWIRDFKHYGDLSATQEVELLRVEAVAFEKVLLMNPEAHRVACQYAEALQHVIYTGEFFSDSEIIKAEQAKIFVQKYVKAILTNETEDSETGSAEGGVRFMASESRSQAHVWQRRLYRKFFRAHSRNSFRASSGSKTSQ